MKINIPKVNISKNLIPVAIIIAGILIAGAFVYVNFWPKGVLSAQQAAEKAIAFINQNIEQGATASLVQVTEEDNVYKISLKVNEIPYESYITKDGKFLFPSGIDLGVVALQELGTEVTAEPSGEQSSAVASESFAKCLTEKGMKFYGSQDCSWCSKEKTLLGDSMQYVNYVECIDDEGQFTKACQDANITSFPTWQLPDGRMESGFKTLEQLAEVSGCSL
ncbi:MAG: hypothetical protein ABIG29_01300 [Candidatus Nealsonbacteria bacterium]